MKLDPWDDAQTLAERLAKPNAKLVVAVGALAWCQKCRDYLPIFEQQAASAPAHESHVWLDVEEHSSFLGKFVPEDLPFQLIYESGQMTQAIVLRASGEHEFQDMPDPGIHTRLCANDWAS
jgi:thiol-disulfide isomerase/thioredoxin